MLYIINLILAQGCPGMPEGQQQPTPEGACGQGNITSLIFIILIFVIFYFLFIRPSQQKQKKHSEMIDSLQKGDRIVTQGGIHGKITSIKKNTVKIRIDRDTEIEVEKSLIGRVKGTQQEE